ncbi:MAG: hypothetical protein QW297_00345 [Candidatus Jordarchaeales archaeon]
MSWLEGKELILLIGQNKGQVEKLNAMNRGKVGRPFTTNSFIWALGVSCLP